MIDSISLYIHIPFCKRKCSYCDFFSISCGENNISENYIDSLIIQANNLIRQYNIKSWKTIYIGGGTPSLLKPEQLTRLVKNILKLQPNTNSLPVEITMECNPDDITEQLLIAAQEVGVNRISVGVQSLSDDVLQIIERRCTQETTQKALSLIHNFWKGKFSVDLIAGLPLQTTQILKDDISKVIEYCPDHISLYSLTLEENTSLFRKIESGKIDYDEDTSDSLWLLGRDILEQKGFHQYEVSNFSLPGFESIHNQTYWNLENYIGIGAGATGTLYNADGNGIRQTVTNDISNYIQNANNDSIYQTEFLSKETQEFEYLMMNLRTLKGLCENAYFNRFHKDLNTRLEGEKQLFSTWQRKGLCHAYTEGNEKYFALTKEGLLFLNSFCKEL